MTKTGTDRLAVLAAAAALATALSLLLLFWRLPQTLELIVPRRPAFWFFGLGAALREAPAASAACLALMLGGAAAVFWRVWALLRPAWSRSWRRVPGALLGLLLLGKAGHFALRLWLDLVQNVWWLPESVDAGELGAAWAGAFLAGGAVSSGVIWLARWTAGGERRAGARALAWAAAVVLPAALLHVYAAARYDRGGAGAAAAAGLSGEAASEATLLLLKEGSGAAAYDVFRVALGADGGTPYSEESLRALEEYARRGPSAHRLEALRHLYTGRAMLQDAEGVREALVLAEGRGDALARFLLLVNLSRAPLTPRAQELLSNLSNERSYRVGARGAALLSAAYARFGDSGESERWRARAGAGLGGVEPGLLAPAGAAVRGVIRGSLPQAPGSRVGLYAHPDPEAPYTLGPGDLVASAATDAKGRFEFRDLPRGDYFLAFTLATGRMPVLRGRALGKCYMGEGGAPPCVTFVSGHAGDLRIDAPGRRLSVGPIELHLVTR